VTIFCLSTVVEPEIFKWFSGHKAHFKINPGNLSGFSGHYPKSIQKNG